MSDLEKLTNPTVGLNAKSGVVIIRITATAASEAEADRLIAAVERTARERLGDAIFGVGSDTLEGVLLAQLAERGETVAVIESGTAGRLGEKLAEADRGHGTFKGGQVVPLTNTDANTVSVAQSAAQQFNATWGIACAVQTTGNEITVRVGIWSANATREWQRGFGGHPGLAPEWSANLAFDTLRKQISIAGTR